MAARTRGPRVVVLLAALGLALGAGCGRTPQQVDVSSLQITRDNLNVDAKHQVARVIAEISNPGDKRVSQAVVTAMLQGPGDRDYASCKTVIDNLEPGEIRVFGIQLEANGREQRVEFRIAGPEELEADRDVESADSP